MELIKTSREAVKVLLELAPNAGYADEIITKNYGFKSVKEKIAFLKGMFDIKCVGHEADEPDEETYYAMLTAIKLQ